MLLRKFTTINDLWNEYVALCGEYEPELSLEALRDLWHDANGQYDYYYDDDEMDVLEAFWDVVFNSEVGTP